MKYYKQHNLRGFVFDCKIVDNGVIPTSEIPKFSPATTCSIDFTCLTFFVFFMWYKTTWRQTSKYAQWRFYAMLTIYILCLSDMILSIIITQAPYITNFSRPVVVLIYLSQSRAHFKSILYLIKDSSILLASIFAYVAFYAFVGYFIFKNTYEGYTYF